MWLTCLYSYRGLDMSAAQFHSNPPRGVEFGTLNILDPVPTELENTFDVLHLRLLVLGLPTGTWTTASQNILKLLKPGGWIQWEEADFGCVILSLSGHNLANAQLSQWGN